MILKIGHTGSITSDFEISAHGLDFKSSFRREAYDKIVADVSVLRNAGPFSLGANMDNSHRIAGIRAIEQGIPQ